MDVFFINCPLFHFGFKKCIMLYFFNHSIVFGSCYFILSCFFRTQQMIQIIFNYDNKKNHHKIIQNTYCLSISSNKTG